MKACGSQHGCSRTAKVPWTLLQNSQEDPSLGMLSALLHWGTPRRHAELHAPQPAPPEHKPQPCPGIVTLLKALARSPWDWSLAVPGAFDSQGSGGRGARGALAHRQACGVAARGDPRGTAAGVCLGMQGCSCCRARGGLQDPPQQEMTMAARYPETAQREGMSDVASSPPAWRAPEVTVCWGRGASGRCQHQHQRGSVGASEPPHLLPAP